MCVFREGWFFVEYLFLYITILPLWLNNFEGLWMQISIEKSARTFFTKSIIKNIEKSYQQRG